jgi:general secretion pathway protein E
VVLRLLDKERGRVGLEELGMAEDSLRMFLGAVSRSHRIVLATGPTGSGKTTTLYAAVERIRTGREKILTVEDPVEYELERVPQVPVHERVGVTFATALRLAAGPRRVAGGGDPGSGDRGDRDALGAHPATSCSQRCTPTTRWARSPGFWTWAYRPTWCRAWWRWSWRRRLVRTVCRACGVWEPANAVTRRAFETGAEALKQVRRGVGCGECWNADYRGRSGVYEFLLLDDEVRAAVVRRGTAGDVRDIAIRQGMRTLRQDGLRLVRAGLTTPEEVLRACGA